MKAHELYTQLFEENSLSALFLDRIANASSVGRDGVRVGIFENRLAEEVRIILRKTENQTYTFTGYKQKLISKGADKKPRQISIPTVRDRLTLRALCDILNQVFAHAKNPAPHSIIKGVSQALRSVDDSHCFLRLDIKDFYPSVNHERMMKRIRSKIRKAELTGLVEKAIKTPTGAPNIPQNQRSEGIPQGLSISNIMSSIYLEPLDRKYAQKYAYFRYVDDVLIVCPQATATKIHDKVSKELKRQGLETHPLSASEVGKTTIVPVANGVDYLGYRIFRDKISIRPSSYKNMFQNLSKVFTKYRYNNDLEQFLWRINLRISGCVYEGKRMGWMHFFAQTEDLSQLAQLDQFVAKVLKKYGLERHMYRVKTFIKSYHEIRFRADRTTYIPNFESYSYDEKVATVALLTRRTTAEVEAMSIPHLERTFFALTAREVSILEKDLLDVTY